MLDGRVIHAVVQVDDLDVLLAPDGLPAGYAQLLPGSVPIRPHGIPVRLAGLADIVASKRATGRARDLAALPELTALLQAEPPGSGHEQ